MRLHQLSKWHLEQLSDLSKVTHLTLGNDKWEFWSGVSKLGDSKITPTIGGFIVSERYDSHEVLEADFESLTNYFYVSGSLG